MKLDYQVIVVGGGASGLFCAKSLKERGLDVLVMEKMSSPGKKLLITGGGMCNVTREEETHLMLRHYGNQGKFLGSSFSSFSPLDAVDWFEKRGVRLVAREDKKIFPQSKKASTILYTLYDNSYPILFNSPVESIEKKNDLFLVNGTYNCKYLVIATGGISYPTTGSNGDGYILAKSLKHEIINPKPSLTSLKVSSENIGPLEGTSLKNVEVSVPFANSKKKKFHKGTGDFLFTRNGISGPIVLDLSRYCESGMKINLNLNEKVSPISSKIKLSNLLRRETQLTARLVEYLLNSLDIEDKSCNEIKKANWEKLNQKLRFWEMEISLKGTYKFAMSTEGGVSTKEIDNKTFESKIEENLYFVGEVMDYSGDCGGYNLQACWSTAFSVAESIKEKNR